MDKAPKKLTLSSLKKMELRAQSTWAKRLWSITLHINSKTSTSHWLWVWALRRVNNWFCHSLSSGAVCCRSRRIGGIFAAPGPSRASTPTVEPTDTRDDDPVSRRYDPWGPLGCLAEAPLAEPEGPLPIHLTSSTWAPVAEGPRVDACPRLDARLEDPAIEKCEECEVEWWAMDWPGTGEESGDDVDDDNCGIWMSSCLMPSEE